VVLRFSGQDSEQTRLFFPMNLPSERLKLAHSSRLEGCTGAT